MESSLEVTFVLDHGTYFAQRCSQPVKVNRPSFPQSSKTNAEDKPFKWSPSIWSCTVQALFEYRRIVCDLFGDPGKICIILVDDCCRTLDAKFLHSDETLDEWLKTNGAFTLKENENGPSILSGIKMAIDRMDMENTGKAIPTNCPNRIITITHFKDEAEVKKLLDEVYNHMLTVPTRSDFEICLINTYPDKVDGAVKPMQSNTVQFFQNRKLAIRLFVDKELCWLVDHQKDCNAHIDWLYEVKDLNDDGSQVKKEERPYSTLPEVTYLPEIGNIGMMSLQESNAADSWSQADGSPWCNFTSVHNMRQNTLHVYLYNCEAGAPLFNKIYQIVQRHYDLASLTVCNIPMKEEVSEAESGSKPYNVELLHPRKVLEDVWKAGLVRNNGTIYVTAANSTYMTFKVNWGSVWRSHEKDLQFSTMAVPCTPVSINQRETMCLTNYILSGRIVLICVDLPDDGRIYTHALVSRNGRLYVQSLQIGRSSFEMLPSRKNGPGTAVTDYRVNAFQELIEDSLLKPGGPTIPKGTAEKYLIEITEYWPINNSSSVLFALSSRLEPLLSHMRKKILTECDQEECRRVLLDINTSSLKNEPLPMGNCKKMAGMTAKQQYSVLWAELNKYVSTYAHHSKAHESLLVALQQVTQKSGTVQKESKQSSIQKLKTAAHQMELIEQALADEAGLLCGDDDGELGEVAGKQSLLDYCSQVHDEEHYTKWRDFEGRVAMNAGGEVILYRNLGNKALLLLIDNLIVQFPKFEVHHRTMTEDTLTFQYVIENIPGPGCDDDLFEQTLLGCNCRSYCRSSTGCSCQPYGENYNEQSLLIQEDRFRRRFDRPVIECGANCTCGPGCGNRVVQNGISIPVEIFHTNSAKGYGLRCSSAIRDGQFVVTYAGEIIGVEESRDRLAAAYRSEQPCFLFTLREQAENCASPLVTYVDASLYGNIGRFVNHSCQPNLNIIVVRYSTPVPHLAMFANRDIVEFEELCYSYGTFRSQSTQARKVCLCGTSSCFGYLPYDF